jgi:hypothetical protein
MYKFEGSKYRESRDLSVAEIGKLIKKEFKKEFPEIKLSVKSQVYSGGCSIHAQITEYKGRVFTEAYLQYRTEPDYMLSNMLFRDYCDLKRLHCERLVPNVLKVLDRLEEIGNSYNFDDSDSQTDYFSNSFYWFADLDSSFEYKKLEAEKLEYCKRISMKKAENLSEGNLSEEGKK